MPVYPGALRFADKPGVIDLWLESKYRAGRFYDLRFAIPFPAAPHHHQVVIDFSDTNHCERNYNTDYETSLGDQHGNSKTLVDRDGCSGCMCAVGSSSVEFHSDNGHRTVRGKSW
jgi:hypothetical protein